MTTDVWAQNEDAHAAQLDQEARAAFGPVISGVSTGARDTEGRNVRVHFLLPPTAEQITQAAALVAEHNPLALAAIRTGDDVTVTIHAPRAVNTFDVVLTIDGAMSPVPVTLTAQAGGGMAGQQTITSPAPVTIGVIGVAVTEVTV